MTASGFLDHLIRGFDDRREHAQLMHIATDGESYGHHHAHGDMALAYVLGRLADDPDVRLTNYGEFLELHPPEWEVEIHENSSWSCVHGIERWRSDCGCRMRGEWEQRWRGPLRRALDKLKAQLDHLFSTRGRECFPNPWEARNAYIEVILNRDDDDAVREFLDRHGHPDLDPAQVVAALRLLEMQTDAMLMFTSCGWFHDEISGIETVQCLQYAARAIYLARQFGRDFEASFAADLADAPSNVAKFRDGRGVWEQLVRPGVVDLERVLAHHAISLIYQPADECRRRRVYSFDLETLEEEVRTRGRGHLARRPAARPVAHDLERGRGAVRGHPLRRPRFPCRAEPRARIGPRPVRSAQASIARGVSQRIARRHHEPGRARVSRPLAPA